ncbi:MAG: RloB domain-containing protein [Symploca sp. SIO2D2]|nr:RloB domain-containing protein [Symploca sp. SIO2D2]
MKKRDRERKKARRAPYRQTKPVILVVSEGKVTEPGYIRTFAQYYKNSRVKIELCGGMGVPKTIVEYAKNRKAEAEKRAKREQDENLKFDEVWCVFDIDEHPNIPDAIQMASSNGLCLAISNPCFELWLWLHFAPQPGMRERHALQSMLQKHIPGYDKQIDFANIADGYQDAVLRAEQLENAALEDNEDRRNPTTGVWRLTKSILR